MANIQTPPAADITLNHKPSGGLYLNVKQENIVDFMAVVVAFDTVIPNFVDGIEDTVNHKITPGVEGFYHYDLQVYLDDVTINTHYIVTLLKNGSTPLQEIAKWSVAAGLLPIRAGRLVYLTNTDYLTVTVNTIVTSGVDIKSGYAQTFLTVQRER